MWHDEAGVAGTIPCLLTHTHINPSTNPHPHQPVHQPTPTQPPQSGELDTPQRLAYLLEVVAGVKQRTRALDAEARGVDLGGDLADPSHLPPGVKDLGLCVALSGVCVCGWVGGCGGACGWGWEGRGGGSRQALTNWRIPKTSVSHPPTPRACTRSGRAVQGQICSVAGGGRGPLPATHRDLQPRALCHPAPPQAGGFVFLGGAGGVRCSGGARACTWRGGGRSAHPRTCVAPPPHPSLPARHAQTWEKRVRCLQDLKDLGFMVRLSCLFPLSIAPPCFSAFDRHRGPDLPLPPDPQTPPPSCCRWARG